MLDGVDCFILNRLHEDALTTSAALAEEVGLAASTVHERVKKLERQGIIRHYVAVVDPVAVGQSITAFVRLMTGPLNRVAFQTAKATFNRFVTDHPNILECHSVAGEACYLLKVRVPTTNALEALLEEVRIDGYIAQTVCTIVLSTVKETMAINPISERLT